MRSQKTSSDRPKKNASATAVRNARKCAGQSGQKSKVQKNKKQTRNQTSACKIDKKCGGCQFQKMPYKEQLKRKQKQEEKLLGGFCKVSPIIGMEHPYFIEIKYMRYSIMTEKEM